LDIHLSFDTLATIADRSVYLCFFAAYKQLYHAQTATNHLLTSAEGSQV
jgi:hypothetical protein